MTPAFDHLLASHYLRVHRAALGFLRDEQEARETAHDALLKAWRARDRYDPAQPFYPWLYRIVKHTCLDALDRRKHRARSGLDADRVPGEQADADLTLDAKREADRLTAALASLGAEHQEILNLRHFQDLTYAEIATLLEVPEGTVMSRLYRARRAAAHALKEIP